MSLKPLKRVSITEPVTDLKRVPIRECGEALVDYRQVCPELCLERMRFDYERAYLAREGLARRLCLANEYLMKRGYRLSILECWRPAHIQRRMYLASWARFKEMHPDWSDTKLKRLVNRFTAPPDHVVPPPHSTGGAVDLWLADMSGQTLNHRDPYEMRDPAGFLFDAPKLTDEARRHRDLLAEALVSTGVTNYPSEYWHWSYGDQGWAYRGGHEAALYGRVSPEGYVAPVKDDIDGPLVWIED